MTVPLLSVFSIEEGIWKSVVEPVLLTLKSVVVADAVELPMAKSVVAVSPLLALIENLANGDVEPTPTLLLAFQVSTGVWMPE